MSNPLILDDRMSSAAWCWAVAPGQGVLDLAPRMERAGFDSLWVGDHVSFSHSRCSNRSLCSLSSRQ